MSTPIYTIPPTNKTSEMTKNCSSASSSPNYGAIPSAIGNVTIGGSGGSGIYQITSAGTGTSYPWNGVGASAWPNQSQGKLTVSGDAEFEGNIHMNGRNLTDVLSNIESRLAILRPNPALEEEYDELKELGDQYRKLEQKLVEKQRTFDILKKK